MNNQIIEFNFQSGTIEDNSPKQLTGNILNDLQLSRHLKKLEQTKGLDKKLIKCTHTWLDKYRDHVFSIEAIDSSLLIEVNFDHVR